MRVTYSRHWQGHGRYSKEDDWSGHVTVMTGRQGGAQDVAKPKTKRTLGQNLCMAVRLWVALEIEDAIIMLPQNIIEWELLHNGCCVIAELIGSLVFPVAVPSTVWVWGRWLAGNVDSNPAGGYGCL